MAQLMYHYSYGDEGILGSTITVTKLNKELYQIVLIQESLGPIFNKLESNYTLINKDSHVDFIDVNEDTVMYKNTTTIKVKAQCNPPPEDLFKIVPGH